VAQRLPRFEPHVQREAAKLDKLVEEVEFAATAGATGDGRRLRGIPVLARGVRSAAPGTRPATASGSERVTRPYEAEEEC